MNWIKKNKVFTIIIVVVVVVLFFTAINQNNSSTKQSQTINSPAQKTITVTPNNTAASPNPTGVIQYVFDIPSLVGKDVDGVRTILGKPSDKDIEPNSQQMQLGVSEWSNTFEKNGKELLVTFNPKTRGIIDFFISADDPSGKTQSTSHLLELGNLRGNDSKYKIEFVKTIKDPSSFTGVKAIPN